MTATAVVRCAIVAIALTVAATAGVRAAERVAFESWTPEDYAPMVAGNYRQHAAQIHGFLTVPRGATGKVPAVVVVPGSGGYSDWIQTNVADPLVAAGIATFIVDSFAGRGVGETASDQGRVPMAASVLDAFAALRTLAAHPAIDPNRIGITGFSRGGVAAMFTVEARLRTGVLGDDGPSFAAHAPFYPGCSTRWQNPTPSRAPMLFLLGGKDEGTPAALCVDYQKRLAAAGGNVRHILYPDAPHGWVSSVKQNRIAAFAYGECDLTIRDDGIIVDSATGVDTRAGWRPFVVAVTRACATRGYVYGEEPEARRRSIIDIVTFFREALAR